MGGIGIDEDEVHISKLHAVFFVCSLHGCSYVEKNIKERVGCKRDLPCACEVTIEPLLLMLLLFLSSVSANLLQLRITSIQRAKHF